MWVHTTDGFYSAVAHREQPDTIIVRARSRSDLQRLRKNHPAQLKGREIVRTFAADYPFRMEMPRADWALIMFDEADRIDYDNFKNSLNPAIAVERHQTLLRVWWTLQQIEYERSAHCRKPKRHPKVALRHEPQSWDWDDPVSGDAYQATLGDLADGNHDGWLAAHPDYPTS